MAKWPFVFVLGFFTDTTDIQTEASGLWKRNTFFGREQAYKQKNTFKIKYI